MADGAIRSKTGNRYPAPLAALGAIRDGCNRTLDEGLDAEREAALGLFGTPIAANLIAVFFMKNRQERDPGVADPSVRPRSVHRVGVAGAGLMGAGIATAHARSGLPTAMVDVDEKRLAAGLERAGEVVTSRIAIGRATPEDLARMLGLLSTSTSPRIFADCDVVVEAINEDEEAKTALYRTIGPETAGGRDPREQHLNDLDHPDGGVGPLPRAVRRHALLPPGRPDGAGGGRPRRTDQRRDGRDGRGDGQATPERRRSSFGTAPGSWSTGSSSRT